MQIIMPGAMGMWSSPAIAWPPRTALLEKNPMYIRITSIKGRTAPNIPNCARLWIICGSPSLGPCAEW